MSATKSVCADASEERAASARNSRASSIEGPAQSLSGCPSVTDSDVKRNLGKRDKGNPERSLLEDVVSC